MTNGKSRGFAGAWRSAPPTTCERTQFRSDASWHCHRSADWSRRVATRRDVADWQYAHLPNTIRRNPDASGPVRATSQPRSVSVAVPRCALMRIRKCARGPPRWSGPIRKSTLRSRRTGQVQWNFLARRCRWYARSWVAFIFSKSGAPVGRMGQVSGAKSGESHTRSWREAGWLSVIDPDKRLLTVEAVGRPAPAPS